MNIKYWDVKLTPKAKNDFAAIIRWTRKEFGERQAQTYQATLRQAIQALHDGLSTLGVKRREDLGANFYTLHVARKGRKGRHFIVFRVVESTTIQVLRLLHDTWI